MTGGRTRLPLTMAVSDGDHVRDLVSGAVAVEGVELTSLLLEVEEIFFRFTLHREWHISELSMGKLVALRGARDDSLIGIPVFLSRMFRHSALYIRADGPVDDPAALRGGRIGFPEWTVTATIYAAICSQRSTASVCTTSNGCRAGPMSRDAGRRSRFQYLTGCG